MGLFSEKRHTFPPRIPHSRALTLMISLQCGPFTILGDGKKKKSASIIVFFFSFFFFPAEECCSRTRVAHTIIPCSKSSGGLYILTWKDRDRIKVCEEHLDLSHYVRKKKNRLKTKRNFSLCKQTQFCFSFSHTSALTLIKNFLKV